MFIKTTKHVDTKNIIRTCVHLAGGKPTGTDLGETAGSYDPDFLYKVTNIPIIGLAGRRVCPFTIILLFGIILTGIRTATMKDFCKAFLVRGARFAGKYEIPEIVSCNEIPVDVIPFSRARRTNTYDRFICFYERDVDFNCVVNRPRVYLPLFRRYRGIIGTDTSLFWDMPFTKQLNSTFDSRALSYWYQKNGVNVIPNVRFGKENTYEFCFDGLPKNSVVAVGTQGYTKNQTYLSSMIQGFSEMIRRIIPGHIVIYGSVPSEITYILDSHTVPYTVFKSDTGRFFARRNIKLDKGPLLPYVETALQEGA